jgi:hypothetical protein
MSTVRTFVVATMLTFAAAALIFRLVDPHGDFGTGVFPVVVRNGRSEKIALFAHWADGGRPGLVLGSSRSMKLAPAVLAAATGVRYFNFAVDNAHAEDDLAIERWVHQRRADPSVAIIGLDIEALHNDDVPDDGFSGSDDLRRALDEPRGVLDRLWTYKRAFTTTYAADTLTAIRLRVEPARRPRFYFEPDGRLRDLDTEALRARGDSPFAGRLETCLEVYVARFQGMTGLSPRRQRYLDATIGEIRAAGGQVIVWLTPLHPVTITRLEQTTRYRELHDRVVAYLAELRAARHITTMDLSTPDRYGGTLTDWDDCAHPDDAESARIAARLATAIR